MPLVRISLIKGKSLAHIRAISEGVHRALMQAFEAPKDDKFQIVQQLERDELIYDSNYLGIQRTDDIVFIDIVASNWRNIAQKKALFKTINDNLVKSPGLRPEDILIVISPNAKEDWSFGNGVASYVADAAA